MAKTPTSTKQIADNLANLVDSENFLTLDIDIQKNLIDKVAIQKQTESGEMGKLLGTKMPNMAVYSAFLLCRYLLIFAGVSMLISWYCGESLNFELIKIIIPVFTMSLGYMFGKSENNNDKKEVN